MGNYDLLIIIITAQCEHRAAIKGSSYNRKSDAIKWAIDDFMEMVNEHNELFFKESDLPDKEKTVEHLDDEIVGVKVYEIPTHFAEVNI